MFNILTFDVEDWYHGFDLPAGGGHSADRLSIGLDFILETLDSHATHATFFILGQVAQSHPTWVRRLTDAGHELGTHGWNHTPLYRLTPIQFREALCRSVSVLQDVSGRVVQGHRAAFFSITQHSLWALAELADAGIRFDSSIFPVHNYRYGLPRAPRFPHRWPALPLWEFPLSTLRLAALNVPFSGGYYARFWPYAGLRWGIQRLNQQEQPAIVYFHPWEFDPHPPKGPGGVSWLARTTHYHRLSRTPAILHALLRDFRWTTMGDFLTSRLLICSPSGIH